MESLQNAEDKAEVSVYKFVTRVCVVVLDFFKKLLLFFFCEFGELGCVYTADFYFVYNNFNQSSQFVLSLTLFAFATKNIPFVHVAKCNLCGIKND